MKNHIKRAIGMSLLLVATNTVHAASTLDVDAYNNCLSITDGNYPSGIGPKTGSLASGEYVVYIQRNATASLGNRGAINPVRVSLFSYVGSEFLTIDGRRNTVISINDKDDPIYIKLINGASTILGYINDAGDCSDNTGFARVVFRKIGA
jgi:hypothetical protein